MPLLVELERLEGLVWDDVTPGLPQPPRPGLAPEDLEDLIGRINALRAALRFLPVGPEHTWRWPLAAG